jgi:uncharacterized RDD family membrane protein YckC
MSERGPAPGWYPDPEGFGGQRYFDGATWTPHRWPPGPPTPSAAGYGPYGGTVYAHPWKGAAFGRPAAGPGSLASPGIRLLARLLDSLVLLPVFILITGVTLAIVAPHVGPIFPRANADPNTPGPPPGFIWLYLAFFASAMFFWVLSLLYEAIAIGRYGRTLGKRWMHIRPVRMDGSPLGWGRAFGRVGVVIAAGAVGLPGILDPLWCLWDDNTQCLHDKAVGTIVVNDA